MDRWDPWKEVPMPRRTGNVSVIKLKQQEDPPAANATSEEQEAFKAKGLERGTGNVSVIKLSSPSALKRRRTIKFIPPPAKQLPKAGNEDSADADGEERAPKRQSRYKVPLTVKRVGPGKEKAAKQLPKAGNEDSADAAEEERAPKRQSRYKVPRSVKKMGEEKAAKQSPKMWLGKLNEKAHPAAWAEAKTCKTWEGFEVDSAVCAAVLASDSDSPFDLPDAQESSDEEADVDESQLTLDKPKRPSASSSTASSSPVRPSSGGGGSSRGGGGGGATAGGAGGSSLGAAAGGGGGGDKKVAEEVMSLRAEIQKLRATDDLRRIRVNELEKTTVLQSKLLTVKNMMLAAEMQTKAELKLALRKYE